MNERDDDLTRMVAAGDQLDAYARDAKAARQRRFEEGPDPNGEQLEPLRLWQEGGLWCAILPSPLGALNGYVRLPDGHPWEGLDCDDPAPGPGVDLEQPAEQAVDDYGVITVFAAALSEDGLDEFDRTLAAHVPVHGGVTFTGPLPIAGAPHGWWLGFDCGHAGDAIDPKFAPPELVPIVQIAHGTGHLWTEEDVMLEVKRMVTAIRAAEKGERE